MLVRTILLGASLVLLTIFAGCRQPSVNDVVSPTIATRQVKDGLNRTITIPVTITRAVSTAPSITENIFFVGAGDRLVGVTTFCNYPEAANSIPKIGDTMTPNMETIIALKPDVVFVSTASQIEAFTKTLEQNGIAVYVANPQKFDDILTELRSIASLFGTNKTAEASIWALEGRIRFVGHIVSTRLKGWPPKERIFVQISKEPLFTIGKDSFLTEVVEKAGGVSVTKNVQTAYPKLSKETAIALQPEVMILSDSPDNQEPNDAFRNSSALKNGRVYKVNADILARPGPRLVEALEQIAEHLAGYKIGLTEE